MSIEYSVEAAYYQIPAVKQGTTWPGLTLQFDEDITGWQFRMWVAQNPGCKVMLKYDSEEGNPVIFDATNGIVIWPPEIITMNPGTYKYDIKIIRPDESEYIYITGDWPILNQITK